MNIKIKNFKFFNKNYIYKIINLNLKINYHYINVKIAPEPNGELHLGNLKSFYINIKISKIYNGLLFLKIDDTNPIKEKNIYKNKIIKILNYCKKNYKNNIIKKIYFSSQFFFKLFQYTKLLIKKGIIKKFKNKINKTEKGYYKEKKIYFEIKIKNNYYKIYRIKYKKHYKIKYKIFLFYLYDYSNILIDKKINIKYSLCSVEFKKKNFFYNWLNKKLFKNIKLKQIEFNRINIKNFLSKKKKIKNLKKKKYIKNSKDRRNLSIISLKKNIIKIKNLFYFFEKININKNIRKFDISNFKNLIKKKIKNYKIIIKKKIIKINIRNLKNILIKKNRYKIYKYMYKKFKIKKKIILIKKNIKINKFKLNLTSIIKKKFSLNFNFYIINYSNKTKKNIINKYNKNKIIKIKYYNILSKYNLNKYSKLKKNYYTKLLKIKKFKNKLINSNLNFNKINFKKNYLIKSALNDLNV